MFHCKTVLDIKYSRESTLNKVFLVKVVCCLSTSRISNIQLIEDLD